MKKRPRTPARFPTAKPTIWHKDRTRYSRIAKKQELEKEKGNVHDK